MNAWDITVLVLTGEPLPPLPTIPGRVHNLTGDDQPLPETERDELLLSDASDAEIGLCLGVTRQRAFQLRQALMRDKATRAPVESLGLVPPHRSPNPFSITRHGKAEP